METMACFVDFEKLVCFDARMACRSCCFPTGNERVEGFSAPNLSRRGVWYADEAGDIRSLRPWSAPKSVLLARWMSTCPGATRSAFRVPSLPLAFLA